MQILIGSGKLSLKLHGLVVSAIFLCDPIRPSMYNCVETEYDHCFIVKITRARWSRHTLVPYSKNRDLG